MGRRGHPSVCGRAVRGNAADLAGQAAEKLLADGLRNPGTAAQKKR